MLSRLLCSLGIGTAFFVGVAVAAITCDTNLIPPNQLGTMAAPCTYPRGCYIVESSGPLQGQCNDCTGGPERCRLYFLPLPPQTPSPDDLGGVFVPATSDLANDDLAGLTLPDLSGGGGGPAATDQPIPCNLYPANLVPPGQEAICTTVDTLCVARGPQCTGGTCVRPGASCMSGTGVSPQRKPGAVGANTYCPYTDDVCCAPPAPDGGALDGGTLDATAPADAQHD